MQIYTLFFKNDKGVRHFKLKKFCMRDFRRYFYGVRYYILLRDVFGMHSGLNHS